MKEQASKLALVLLASMILAISPLSGRAGTEVTDIETEKALTLAADLENGKARYEKTCALCHTLQGWGSPAGRFPQIAGQHASVIVKQLADIRAGNRDNPTMAPFTRSRILQDAQEIADVAAYIEQLPMTAENGKGLGHDLATAETLYQDNCHKCHGVNGEGDPEKFVPRIQGQHFQYLARQLFWIQSGKRRNADRKMFKQLKGYSENEIFILADYVSRLKPEKNLLVDSGWDSLDTRKNFLTAPEVQDAESDKFD